MMRYYADMILHTSGAQPIHLTYCLNIHSGETWAAQREAIDRYAREVKARLLPDRPFGLGLRVSAEAAATLAADSGQVVAFSDYLAAHGMYVFTINGFPYGTFHGTPVKEAVYDPDWRTPERLAYTRQLIDCLAAWLPAGQEGSISTVPGGFAANVNHSSDQQIVVENLMRAVAHAADVLDRTGVDIHLGLEPEPACLLETTDDILQLVDNYILKKGLNWLRRAFGLTQATAETWIRRHLGICMDTCHVALAFEDPLEAWDRLDAAGIRLSKIQLSAALETTRTRAAAQSLQAFEEPVYLHQVRIRGESGIISSFLDLPEALEQWHQGSVADVARIHFHVPLFWAGADPLQTTRSTLSPAFWQRLRSGACNHVEMETYTYSVLPATLQSNSITEHIAKEYDWVQTQFLCP